MIDAIRRYWWVTVAFTLGALAIAAAAATVPETKYEAEATLLAQPDAERVDFAAVEAVRFLLPSLAELVSTNTFRGQVGARLQPPLPASEVDARADFEPGTGIVHITGTDPNPARARQITQVASELLGRQQLSNAVVIVVLDPPELPTAEAGPGTGSYLVGGLVLGILGGVLAAIVFAAAARTRTQTLAAAGAIEEPAPARAPAVGDSSRAAPPKQAGPDISAKAAAGEVGEGTATPDWTSFEPATSERAAVSEAEPVADEPRTATPTPVAAATLTTPTKLVARLDALQIPVLASIPVKGRARESGTNGTNDFDSAFRRLAAALATQAGAHPHLLISAPRAGAGCTTVVANAAWAMATPRRAQSARAQRGDHDAAAAAVTDAWSCHNALCEDCPRTALATELIIDKL